MSIETTTTETTTTETTTTAATKRSTDELRHSVVEFLMAVIGAPDDEEIARTADDAVRVLDARLSEERQG
ncbi:hypothetical protein ADL01_14855 [Streptomyces sp. NRRL WC-3618]|uniref:hypothetical protein n=1 Tax=unclassified Streptomyces TaxID=2593676 RepID=UPI0006AE6BF5|nr:hypothetical protein [Streptomyces sp. NRRL WC-3618]KOV78605.1 hypothetical protein ADL01_14855 [Streptomyces sp. NRRL WC-3618]